MAHHVPYPNVQDPLAHPCPQLPSHHFSKMPSFGNPNTITLFGMLFFTSLTFFPVSLMSSQSVVFIYNTLM